jgi:hypothetical protein
LRNRIFTSIQEINQAIGEQLSIHNALKFKRHDCSRLDLYLSQEKATLIPLPEELFHIKKYKQRKLSKFCYIQLGLDYLDSSGFKQHQYIMVRHHDADHPHLHILVNRIGYDGEVMSDSNDYARCERVLRELEKKYNLTQVISSRQAKERAMIKNELEMMKRTNTPRKRWPCRPSSGCAGIEIKIDCK